MCANAVRADRILTQDEYPRSRGGTSETIDKGNLYKILNNPLYIGEMRHKGECFRGEHCARPKW
ncbi:MAG: hypothetical protein ABIN37_05360 [Burkholderiaceae bacterium]